MSLEFKIELGGNFVGALEKTNKALGDTEKESKKAADGIKLFEGELGRAQAGMLGINFNAFADGGHLFTFDLAEGAALAFEAIKKVGEAVFDLGKEFVKTAAEAQGLNLAVKLDVGEEGAEKVNALAESFKKTRFDDDDIKAALLPFIEQTGTKYEGMWDDLLTVGTDMATRTNNPAKLNEVMQAFGDIALKPERLRGALGTLKLNQDEFYTAIGEQFGISEKAAEAKVKAGGVKAQQLLETARNMFAEREEGGLGSDTNKSEGLLGTTLKHLTDLKKNLFQGAAESDGIKAIQGMLDNFVDVMGDEGPMLVNELSGIFVDLFGDLAGPEGAEKLRAGMHEAVGTAKELIANFREAWPEIKQGASAALEVIEAMATAAKAVASALAALPKVGESISDVVFNAQNPTMPEGEDFLARWLHSGRKNVAAGGESRTFGEIGASVPAFAEGGIVTGPTLALIGEDGPEAVVPLDYGATTQDSTALGSASGGGSSTTVNVTVNINSAAQDGDQLGREAAEAIRVELTRFLREAQGG